MAYKNNGTANFNFFLNRQGPRGPQGIQGPQGFSPIVSVEEDVGNTFTLRVTNQDSSFVTSNLREHKEDRGGDYVRYDREGQLMYFGSPDFATTLKAGEVRLSTVDDLTNASEEVALTPKIYKDDITTRVQEINQRIDTTNADVTQVDNRVTALDNSTVKLTGNQTIEGTKTFSSKVRTKGVELGGNNIIQMDVSNIIIGGGNTDRIDLTTNRGATLNNKNILTEANIPSSTTQPLKMENGLVTVQVDNQTIQVQDGKLHANLDELGNEVNAIAGDVAALQADLLGKQGKLTAGENITITEDNVISATGGGGTGDVTLAGDNSFTGNNTFAGETTFNAHTWTSEQEAVTLNVTSNATLKNAYVTGTLSSLGEISAVSIQTAGIKNNQNNKYYLNQASIAAGDNVTVEETTEGVKISSSAPTPTNMVTTDTVQTISGSKTFDKLIIDSTSGRLLTNKIYDANNKLIINRYLDGIVIGTSAHKDSQLNVQGGFNLRLYDDQGKLSKKGYILAQDTVTAGDNITITKTTEGIQISSTGGGTGTGDVTLAGDNVFTGSNKFNANNTDFNELITISKTVSTGDCGILVKGETNQGLINLVRTSSGGLEFSVKTGSAGYLTKVLTLKPSLATVFGNLYVNNGISSGVVYHENNLQAGTGIEFKTVNGVTSINSTGPTNEQIGQILESIADLSTKIDNLTDRVRALEETIDGGIA